MTAIYLFVSVDVPVLADDEDYTEYGYDYGSMYPDAGSDVDSAYNTAKGEHTEISIDESKISSLCWTLLQSGRTNAASDLTFKDINEGWELGLTNVADASFDYNSELSIRKYIAENFLSGVNAEDIGLLYAYGATSVTHTYSAGFYGIGAHDNPWYCKGLWGEIAFVDLSSDTDKPYYYLRWSAYESGGSKFTDSWALKCNYIPMPEFNVDTSNGALDDSYYTTSFNRESNIVVGGLSNGSDGWYRFDTIIDKVISLACNKRKGKLFDATFKLVAGADDDDDHYIMFKYYCPDFVEEEGNGSHREQQAKRIMDYHADRASAGDWQTNVFMESGANSSHNSWATPLLYARVKNGQSYANEAATAVIIDGSQVQFNEVKSKLFSNGLEGSSDDYSEAWEQYGEKLTTTFNNAIMCYIFADAYMNNPYGTNLNFDSKVLQYCLNTWADAFNPLYDTYRNMLGTSAVTYISNYLDSTTPNDDVKVELFNLAGIIASNKIRATISNIADDAAIQASFEQFASDHGVAVDFVSSGDFKLAYYDATSGTSEYVVVGSSFIDTAAKLSWTDTTSSVYTYDEFFEHCIDEGRLTDEEAAYLAFRIYSSIDMQRYMATQIEFGNNNSAVVYDSVALPGWMDKYAVKWSSNVDDGLSNNYGELMEFLCNESNINVMNFNLSTGDPRYPALAIQYIMPYVTFKLIYGDLKVQNNAPESTMFGYYNADIEAGLSLANAKLNTVEENNMDNLYTQSVFYLPAPVPDLPVLEKNWQALRLFYSGTFTGTYSTSTVSDLTRWEQFVRYTTYAYRSTLALEEAALERAGSVENLKEELIKVKDEINSGTLNYNSVDMSDTNSDKSIYFALLITGASYRQMEEWLVATGAGTAYDDSQIVVGQINPTNYWTTGYDVVGDSGLVMLDFLHYVTKDIELTDPTHTGDDSGITTVEAASVSTKTPDGSLFSDGKLTTLWSTAFGVSATYTPCITNLNTTDGFIVSQCTDEDINLEDFRVNYVQYGFFRKALYKSEGGSAYIRWIADGTNPNVSVCTLRDMFTDNDLMLFVDNNFYNAAAVAEALDLNYSDAKTYWEDRVTAYSNGIAAAGSEGKDSTITAISDLMDGGTPDTDDVKESVNEVKENITDAWVANTEDTTNVILKNGVYDLYSTAGPTESLARLAPYACTSMSEWRGTMSASFMDVFGNIQQPSTKRSAALVGYIYCEADYFNGVQRLAAGSYPVWCSSKAVANVDTENAADYSAYINYIYIKALQEKVMTNAKLISELDSPIFIDCYGNIMTYSGIVLIPSAANATLSGSYWSPYSKAWMYIYPEAQQGEWMYIDKMNTSCFEYLTHMTYTRNSVGAYSTQASSIYTTPGTFKFDPSTNQMYFDTVNLSFYKTSDINKQRISSATNGSVVIDWDNYNNISKDVLCAIVYYNRYNVAPNCNYNVARNAALEVWRGARIPEIDLSAEMLDGARQISTLGVNMAYKLEQLADLLNPMSDGRITRGGNSIVSIPNIMYMDGFEYIALIAIKFFLALLCLSLIFAIYKAAVVNRIAWREFGNVIITIVLLASAVLLIPKFITWSYNESNKKLLQKEADMTMLYQYNADFNTTEVGVTAVRDVNVKDNLYIKLSDVSVRWITFLPGLIFESDTKSIQDAYANEFVDDPLYGQYQVVQRGNGVYMDVKDVLDDSQFAYESVTVYDENGNDSVATYISLKSDSGTNPVVSYSIPYYPMMEQLLFNLNSYNTDNHIITTEATIADNGQYVTYDCAADYLLSDFVMDENYDIFGLYTLFNVQTNRISPYGWIYAANRNSYEERMRATAWWPDLPDKVVAADIEELNKYAREWLFTYKDIITKVPDEVFVKVFCFSCAMKWNELTGVGTADSIVIDSISTESLFRLLSGKPYEVFNGYIKSWCRNTYDNYGGFGIILSTIAYAVVWLASWFKPLFIVLLFALICLNIVTRQIVYWHKSTALKGYLISCGILIAVNVAYSLSLKLCFLIARLGCGLIVNYIVLIIFQVAYLFMCFKFLVWLLKDWRDIGLLQYQELWTSIKAQTTHVREIIVQHTMFKNVVSYQNSNVSGNSPNASGSDILTTMQERDTERESHIRDK